MLKQLWGSLRRGLEERPSADVRLASDSARETAWIYAAPSLIEALMVGEAMPASELYGRSLAGDPPPSFEFDPKKEVKVDIAVIPTDVQPSL